MFDEEQAKEAVPVVEMIDEKNIRRWRAVIAPLQTSPTPDIAHHDSEMQYLAGLADALDWVLGERIDNPAVSFVNRFES